MLAGCVGQPAGDQRGQQVRQVGGARHRLVVIVGAEHHRGRAAQLGQCHHQLHGLGVAASSCGVTAHGRPSNSAADAANGPDRSLPAIGWEPT